MRIGTPVAGSRPDSSLANTPSTTPHPSDWCLFRPLRLLLFDALSRGRDISARAVASPPDELVAAADFSALVAPSVRLQ
eukprot:6267080-Prymnesium_polylepis.1